MGRSACRRRDHGVHVSLPRLLHRGDECGSSRCGRHLRLRATRDGPMGRLPVRRLRQRRVCADPCCHLLLHRVLSRQHVRYRLAGLVLVDRDLWPVSRAEHPRHRALVSRHPCHHAHIACDSSAVLRPCRSAYRHRPLGIEHRRRWNGTRRRLRPALSVRHTRCPRRLAVRGMALSRDRGAAAGGRGIHRPAARHAEGNPARARDAHRDGLPDRGDQPRAQRCRRLQTRHVWRTDPRRLPGLVRQCRRHSAGAHRPVGADREFSRHCLWPRAPDLRARPGPATFRQRSRERTRCTRRPTSRSSPAPRSASPS